MPRPTDHDERRAHLIDIAAKLVAKRGMDGLTIREVAKAAGYTTGIVTHYFADKRQLLQMTFDATADAVYGQVAAGAGGGATADARTVLEGFLPLDAPRRRGWRIWLAFWGHAIGDAGLAADQRRRERRARELVERVLRAEIAAARLPARLDVAAAARLVLAAIQGIAAQAVFEPKQWPEAVQRATLEAALRGLSAGR